MKNDISFFKVPTRLGVMTIPYERSFTQYGELFVLHRPPTILGEPAKRFWRCSHYGTGLALHYKDHHEPEDMGECEEKAKAFLKEKGRDIVLDRIKKHAALNASALVMDSLFEED